jgi:hypothetical protein
MMLTTLLLIWSTSARKFTIEDSSRLTYINCLRIFRQFDRHVETMWPNEEFSNMIRDLEYEYDFVEAPVLLDILTAMRNVAQHENLNIFDHHRKFYGIISHTCMQGRDARKTRIIHNMYGIYDFVTMGSIFRIKIVILALSKSQNRKIDFKRNNLLSEMALRWHRHPSAGSRPDRLAFRKQKLDIFKKVVDMVRMELAYCK